ncbi:MAG: sulfurtransferase TusA family protein [Thermaerobacter sp.]|nr:sulfurtransferase TusA family protein [Thermaerobacter sp.]
MSKEPEAKPLPSKSVIDVRGLPCPVSLIRVKHQMRIAGEGVPVVIYCADALVAIDVMVWARSQGWEVTGVAGAGMPETVVQVVKSPR